MPVKAALSDRPPREGAGKTRTGASEADFARIYRGFNASIARALDCGRFCAPLHDGSPLCCSTKHTIPVVARSEWRLLKKRTDLWKPFRAYDATTRQIVAETSRDCAAIECKGAAFCERDNRTLACRAFPFFPYFTREGEIIGISYYWTFEDRCWVLSNLWSVEPNFVRELIGAYEHLFARDAEEEEAYMLQSAQMRRVFSRWRRPFPIIGRAGGVFKVMPMSGGRVLPARISEFKRLGPYRTQNTYARAIRAEGGDPKTAPRLPKDKRAIRGEITRSWKSTEGART